MTDVKGKKVLVMGLGKFGGGVGVTRWLVEQGAEVTVSDLKTADQLRESVQELKGLKFKRVFGKHDSRDVKNADLIVVNPAVKPDSPYLKMAAKWRTPLTTEINLFLERCLARTVGVTGTNGKETVARMIYDILAVNREQRTDNRRVWLGGNIGKSLLPELDKIKPNDLVVLELSSFQLAWLPIIRKSPQVAVIVNITPDHLDWHKTVRAYRDAKKNILRFQKRDDFAVLNWRDNNVKKIAKGAKANPVKVFRPLRDLKLRIPGEHNLMNATLAAEVGRLFGTPLTTSYKLLATFPGVEHALEFVTEKNGIKYYNDSAATTPEATIAALNSFDQPVILIAGGYDKKVNLKPFAQKLKRKVKAIFLIGETGHTLHKLIHGSIHTGSLERAVSLAKRVVKPGEVVLLSPAAASYDQFENLEQRGRIFKGLVLQ